MNFLDQLPENVAKLIQTRFVAEFATVSKAGVPIDTPLVPFTSADLTTIDSATGLAYPTKADRVRRNPKVGMFFEGGANEPVVSIAGFAAVRDRDFQSNLERYLAEEILTPAISTDLVDYEAVTRHAIWYFTRIIICMKPAHIRWWGNPAAMDEPPQEWRAPGDTIYPQSDPAPAGGSSKGSWDAASWQDLAHSALTRRAPGHLTLLDADGFPLPIRVREAHAHAEGFELVMPKWLPWSSGKATLTFQGLETFIGEASIEAGKALFRVERPLPVHPLLVGGPLTPDEATKHALMERIHYELGRRGLPLPQMPSRPPVPTAGARLRAADASAFIGLGTVDL